MPFYRFADLQARVYPETRDGHGELLGVAEPGDVRDFAVPPDHRWLPAEPGNWSKGGAGDESGSDGHDEDPPDDPGTAGTAGGPSGADSDDTPGE